MQTRIPLVLVKTIFKYVEPSLKIYSPVLKMQIMILTERKQVSLQKWPDFRSGTGYGQGKPRTISRDSKEAIRPPEL